MAMNYIDVFIEAIAAEKGRSRNTLDAYKSDLIATQDAIGDLLNATSDDIQNADEKINTFIDKVRNIV